MKIIIKKSLFLIVFAFIISGCQREENTPIAPLSETPKEMATQKAAGEFMDGDGEKASGIVKLFSKDSVYQLFIENLLVNNGPNLHVYLSQEINPKNFVDLGLLKSVKGNQVYDIPSNTDVNSYKYVLIYCKKYSHLFGYAQVK